jgi:hypothetical protein
MTGPTNRDPPLDPWAKKNQPVPKLAHPVPTPKGPKDSDKETGRE